MPTSVVRRQLFATSLLQVGLVAARPSDEAPGVAECQASTVVVLLRRGLFAKHESSHRHVLGTAAHAVLLAKDEPYRIAYPGRVTCAFSKPGIERTRSSCTSNGSDVEIPFG